MPACTPSRRCNERGPEKYPLREVAILCLAMLVNGYNLVSLLPYVGFMVRDILNLETTNEAGFYAGYVASAFTCGRFLSSYAWGHVSDSVGRKPVIIIGLCSMVILPLAFGLSRSYVWAIFFRLLYGLTNGSVPALRTTLNEVCGPEYVVSSMTYFVGSYAASISLGAGLGGVLAQPAVHHPEVFSGGLFDRYPYLLPNAVGSFFGVVTLVLVVVFLPETKEHASASEQHAASQQQSSGTNTTDLMETAAVRLIPVQQSPVGIPTRMTLLYGSCGGDGDVDKHAGDDMLVHDARHKEGDEKDKPGIFGHNGMLAVPHVKTLLFLTGVVSMAQIGLDEVFPLYAQSTPDVGGLSWNSVQIGKVFVASGLVLALCLLILFPPLIKLLGMTAWQRLGWLVSIPCFIAIPAAKTLSWNYPSLFTAATVANTGVAVGLAAAKLTLSVGSTTLVTSDMRGKLGGLYNMFENVGRFLGPAGFATTYAWSVSPSAPGLVNFRFVFFAAAAILAAGTILAWGTMTTENLTRNDEGKGEQGDDDLLRPDVVLLDTSSTGSKTTTSSAIDSRDENQEKVGVDRRDNLFSNSFGIAGRKASMV